MTTNARITFLGNPWPEGHAATLTLVLADDPGALEVALRSEDYYAEREVPDGEAAADWEAPIAWANFHRAALEGTIPVPDEVRTLADLDGLEVRVDHDVVASEDWDWDALAFDHCYILGHDAVAGHTFRFAVAAERLTVEWEGKVALAYVGDHAFRYAFRVKGGVALG